MLWYNYSFAQLCLLIGTVSHVSDMSNVLFHIYFEIKVVGIDAIGFLSADGRNYTSLSEMMTEKEAEIVSVIIILIWYRNTVNYKQTYALILKPHHLDSIQPRRVCGRSGFDPRSRQT